MRQLRALDLFCGAGGATKGLQRAGFHVTGVDIRPQSRYCGDAFAQADALNPPFDLSRFDFIWASPPCQDASISTVPQKLAGKVYPKLIEPTRAMLRACGRPFCIENVPGAKMRADVKLDGTMFPGLKVVRERWFECEGFAAPFLTPTSGAYRGICIKGGFYSVTGHDGSSRLTKAGGPKNSMAAWKDAMGIDWMNREGLTQAIPPAYSEFIGRAALAHLNHREAA